MCSNINSSLFFAPPPVAAKKSFCYCSQAALFGQVAVLEDLLDTLETPSGVQQFEDSDGSVNQILDLARLYLAKSDLHLSREVKP